MTSGNFIAEIKSNAFKSQEGLEGMISEASFSIFSIIRLLHILVYDWTLSKLSLQALCFFIETIVKNLYRIDIDA